MEHGNDRPENVTGTCRNPPELGEGEVVAAWWSYVELSSVELHVAQLSEAPCSSSGHTNRAFVMKSCRKFVAGDRQQTALREKEGSVTEVGPLFMVDVSEREKWLEFRKMSNCRGFHVYAR